MSQLTVTTIRSAIAHYNHRARVRKSAFKFCYGFDGRGEYCGPRITTDRFSTAQQAADAAWADLGALLIGAEWGAQDNGRVFVRQPSCWPQSTDTHVYVLVDGLTSLSGYVTYDRASASYSVYNLRIHDLAAEREARDNERRDRAEREAKQELVREQLAAELSRGRVPRRVKVMDGQRGGYLVVGGVDLAIRGVLKRAGIDPGDHPYDTWIEAIRDLTEIEPAAKIRARKLPPQARHLRAVNLTT